MDGKITLGQILLTLVLGSIPIFFGITAGLDCKAKDIEQKIDAQEKVIWDIEVQKMEEAKPVALPADPNWVTIKMNTSAYCPCQKCCDDWGKIPVSSGKRKTPSGHTIHVGDKFVAAPRKYPFGTEMVVEGYAGGKIVKVEDVGGAIKGNKLDLYFDSHQEALNYGRKDVLVKVRGQAG